MGVNGLKLILRIAICTCALVAISTCVELSDVTGGGTPIAEAGNDQVGSLGDMFYLDGSHSKSVGGAPLSFSWSVQRSPDSKEPAAIVESTNNDTGVAQIKPNLSGTWVIKLVVYANEVTSTPDYVTIRVRDRSSTNASPSGCIAELGECSTETGGAINRPPKVTIYSSSPSNIFKMNTQAFLYAEAFDPDGDTLTYKWKQESGTKVTIENATTATASLTTPAETGEMVISLEVSDGKANGTVTESITLYITNKNSPPIAEAGYDLRVPVSSLVILDGSQSSDPDGDTLTYQWKQKSGDLFAVTIENNRTARARFFAPAEPTTLHFDLTVSDRSEMAIDSVTITVDLAENIDDVAPMADAGPDQRVFPGTQVVLDGTGSIDPDNKPGNGDAGPLIYMWMLVGEYDTPIALKDTNTTRPSFVAPDVTTKITYKFELIVFDGELLSLPDDTYVTVLPPGSNTAPIAYVDPSIKAKTGDLVLLNGGLSYDGEGDPLTYNWRQTSGEAVELSNKGSVAWFTPQQEGEYQFELTVNDGLLTGAPANSTVTVSSSDTNLRPVARVSIETLTITAGSQVTLDGSLSYDDDGDKLTYQWSQISGTSVVIQNASSAKPSFIAPTTPSTITMQLIVNDGKANSYPVWVYITVIEKAGNQAPVAKVNIGYTINPKQAAVLDGTQSYDPDNNPLSYTWKQVSGPEDVTLLNANRAVALFYPEKTGEYTFELKVSDGYIQNQSGDQNQITVTVIDKQTVTLPVADAGDDLTVPPKSAVTLDGSASAGANAKTIFYHWYQVFGEPVTLSSATDAKAIFVAPDEPTYLIFALVVYYETGNVSFPDYVAVEVTKPVPNAPPVAIISDAMKELNSISQRDIHTFSQEPINWDIGGGKQFQTDGSGSFDPNGEPITYLWTADEEVTIDDPTAISPVMTAPNKAGSYIISLVVSDSFQNSLPVYINLTVTGEADFIPLTAVPTNVPADPSQSIQVNGGPVKDSAGKLVADGTMITVAAVDKTDRVTNRGTIIAGDASSTIAGKQITTKSGLFNFTLLADSTPGKVIITADGVPPSTAHGETEVTFEGGNCGAMGTYTLKDTNGEATNTMIADNQSTLTLNITGITDIRGAPIADETTFYVDYDTQYLSIVESDAVSETPEFEVFSDNDTITLHLKSKSKKGTTIFKVYWGRCVVEFSVNLVSGYPAGTLTCDVPSAYQIAAGVDSLVTCGPVLDSSQNEVGAGAEFTIEGTGIDIVSQDVNAVVSGIQVVTSDNSYFSASIKGGSAVTTGANLKLTSVKGSATYNKTIEIVPGPIHHFAFDNQPGDITADDSITTVTIKGYDQFDNFCTNDNSTAVKLIATNLGLTITPDPNSPNKVLSGGAVQYGGYYIRKVGTTKLRATSVQSPSVVGDSLEFQITHGAIHHLVYNSTTIPSPSTVDSTVAATIEGRDAYDNKTLTSNATVTLNLSTCSFDSSSPSGQLSNGVVTLSGKLGCNCFSTSPILTASAPSVQSVSTNAFSVGAGSAVKLNMISCPNATESSSDSIQVEAFDRCNRRATSSSASVSLSLNCGGSASRNLSSGVATIGLTPSCSCGGGSGTITASSSGLTSASCGISIAHTGPKTVTMNPLALDASGYCGDNITAFNATVTDSCGHNSCATATVSAYTGSISPSSQDVSACPTAYINNLYTNGSPCDCDTKTADPDCGKTGHKPCCVSQSFRIKVCISGDCDYSNTWSESLP